MIIIEELCKKLGSHLLNVDYKMIAIIMSSNFNIDKQMTEENLLKVGLFANS